MINKKFVKRKISLIGDELEHLKNYSDLSFEKVVKDFKTQAIVERVLERIINRAIDINQHLISESSVSSSFPKSYKETFLKLAEINVFPEAFAKQIAKSVGTRNVLVHEYDKVDYTQIYSSIKDCLKDYHRYCQHILDFIDQRSKNRP